MTTGSKAAIYARISQTDADVDKPANQTARLTQALAAIGITDVTVYVDDGKSAWKDDVKRPDWERLQADVAKGLYSVVAAQNFDRFTRAGTMPSLLWLALCAQHGVKWFIEGQGLQDTADPNADITTFFAGRQANQESALKSKRLRERYASDRAAGRHRAGGHRPFGWTRDGSLDPVEAPLLKQAVADVIAGASLVSVVKAWNSAEVKTPFGGVWVLKNLGNVLSNPRLYGALRHKGEIVGEGTWEPICSKADFDTLQSVLASRKQGSRRTSSVQVQYLLSHVITCGVCGSVMIGRHVVIRGEKHRYYFCRARRENAVPGDTRTHPSASVKVADEKALNALVSALTYSGGSGVPDDVSARLSGLYERQSAISARRARVTELALDPDMDHVTLKKQAAALTEESKAVQAEIEELLAANAEAALLVEARAGLFEGGKASFSKTVDVKEKIRERLDGLSHDQKKALVRHYLDIAVMPGRGAQRIDVQHKVATSLNGE